MCVAMPKLFCVYHRTEQMNKCMNEQMNKCTVPTMGWGRGSEWGKENSVVLDSKLWYQNELYPLKAQKQ